MSVLLLLLISVCLGLFLVYKNFKKSYKLWKSLDIPYLEPKFPLGNAREVAEVKHFAFVSKDLYTLMKKSFGGDYAGIYLFNRPMLYVLTPEFAKTIMVRDFQYFIDRGVYFNKRDDPLSANLFFIEGAEWKILRNKLSPTFTSGKMKMMYHTINDICDKFINYIATELNDTEGEFEITDLMARYTTDAIVSCAFGLEANTIQNPNSKFRQMGKKMFHYSKFVSFKLFMCMLYRKPALFFRTKFTDETVTTFITNIVQQTVKHRRETGERRNDLMQILIDLLDEEGNSNTTDKLSVEEIAAQTFVFFFAGFETSSATLTFILYELANNFDVQERLRKEILECKDGDGINYETVLKMPYLDRVVNETLRMYPPVASLHRIVNKDYPMANGKVLPEGTFVVIPNYAFQHDPEIFPEPERFNPDRFTDEETAKRHNFSYLPFGEGPRICIGQRFGLLQVKLAIVHLLLNFQLFLSPKTSVPLEINHYSLTFTPVHDVYLKLRKI